MFRKKRDARIKAAHDEDYKRVVLSMAVKSCPICGKALDEPEMAKLAPFCSARCKDVDLHRWLSGQYAIPAVEQDDSDAAEETPAAPRSDRSLLH